MDKIRAILFALMFPVFVTGVICFDFSNRIGLGIALLIMSAFLFVTTVILNVLAD